MKKWADWERVLLRMELDSMGRRKNWDQIGRLLSRHPDECKRQWANIRRKRNQQKVRA